MISYTFKDDDREFFLPNYEGGLPCKFWDEDRQVIYEGTLTLINLGRKTGCYCDDNGYWWEYCSPIYEKIDVEVEVKKILTQNHHTL